MAPAPWVIYLYAVGFGKARRALDRFATFPSNSAGQFPSIYGARPYNCKHRVGMKSVLLVTDDGYLDVILKLIEHAQSSIDILAFSFAIGSTSGRLAKNTAPHKIAEAIAARKSKLKSKLKVRLYIESYRETAERNQVTAKFLKKAGVQVKYGATHAKGFCVDNKYVLFGSTNLTHQSIVKNLETNLLLQESDAVKGFNEYFDHLWKGGTHGGVQLTPPMIADGGFKDVLVELIDTAQKSLEFSIYFFHHSEIENALIRAHERGVKVRGFIHDHAVFALSYVRRTHGTAKRLAAAGIKDLHFGPNHLFSHSKYIIKDKSEILLGTGNWLHEDVKVHPQLYIHLQNPSLAKELSKHLASVIRSLN